MNDTWMWLALAALVAVPIAYLALRPRRRRPLQDTPASAHETAMPAKPSASVVEATLLAQQLAHEQARLDAEQAEQAEEEAQLLAAYREAEEAAVCRAAQARTAAAAAAAAAEAKSARQAQAARHAAEHRAAEAAAAAAAEEEAARRKRAEESARQESQRQHAERQQAERREAARLEVERLANAAARQQAERPVAAAPRKPEQTLVMVADDSKVVRVKTSRLLAAHHYRISLAENGEAALRLIEAEPPQLLITDVEMPGIDGFELTRRVRSNPHTAHIPIIMITSADDRLRAAAAEAGVSVLLGKPYAEDELMAQIARLGNCAAADLAADASA